MSHEDWEATNAEEQAMIDRLGAEPGETSSAGGRERARLAFLEGEGRPLNLKPDLSAYQRWGGVLAAAAILLLVLIQYGRQPVDVWRVTAVVNPVGVVGFDAPVATGLTLNSGRVATGSESELELQIGQDLQIRLIPDSEVELPSGPGRWFGNARTLRLRAGEVFGTSGGGELGWKLTLAGREAEAELTGTTFAIFLRDDSTCFCLFEGGLRVKVLATGESIDLPVGQRVWIYDDGRTEMGPLDARETMKLRMSRDRGIQP
jgi:hypothetical protein